MHFSYAGPDLTRGQRRVVRLIERLTQGNKINDVRKHFERCSDQSSFFNRVASALQLRFNLCYTPRAYLPSSGPLLVVANHPFGIIDGLAISAALENVRSDIKIIVWDSINIPVEQTHFLALDLSSASIGPLRQNVAVRQAAINHLKAGHCIVLFPSGSAEITKHPLAKPEEALWTTLACKLATRSNATLLPVFVDGHNSRLFHAASHISDLVRRSLFLSETLRMRGSTVNCRFGEPILPEAFHSMLQTNRGCMKRTAAQLRQMTLSLKEHADDMQ